MLETGGGRVNTDAGIPLLEVRGLKKHYPVPGGWFGGPGRQVRALDGISFKLQRGSTLGIVGESGCGKSTAAKTIMRLIEPTGGQILIDGLDITAMSRAAFRPHRKDVQIVFQDPYASLNPRMSAGAIVAEPLRNFGAGRVEREQRVRQLFDRVGLHRESLGKYPHEFSGGQRQRLGIARALAHNPRLIVCDEPVSALDVSIQAQVINLLMDLQDELGISYLFVAHDLAVVQHICDRVAVMYLGRIVEIGDRGTLFASPRHPYTQALLAAVPVPDPGNPRRHILLGGDVPSPMAPPSGCHFHTRCPFAMERCRLEAPLLRPAGNGSEVACHLDFP
jgi:oligopeptide/dipeptide ABC transporter ATP-binding protein